MLLVVKEYYIQMILKTTRKCIDDYYKIEKQEIVGDVKNIDVEKK